MSKEAMKLALGFAIMHHTDAGYTEVRYAVQAALREALAEQSAPVQGWKLVPVDPTPEQIKEGNKVTWPSPCAQVYSTMLAAAPQPAQQQQEPVAIDRIIECAKRLVEHADFQLGGVLSQDSKAKDIPSRAVSQVKARHLAALRDALANTSPPAQPQPFEIEWPEYNEHAMGCGLEDIEEYCRYRAMRYGWDCAIEAVKQAIPDSIYTSPPAQRVGLTNKKIDSIQQEWIAKGMSGSRSFARAIEAAHGIKENT